MKKRKTLKTYIITRSYLKCAAGAVIGMLFILIFAALLSCATNKNDNFVMAVMDWYFGKNKAYAEAWEIISDSNGRVGVIMDSYTRLVTSGIKSEEKVTEKKPDVLQDNTVQEMMPAPTPKIIESTAKSLTEIKNLSGKTIDADSLFKEPLKYKIASASPSVLIVHTHTTESYFEQDRSVDEEKNMTAVGKVLKKKLEEGGIGCIHDATVHDYPSYNGAYTLSAATTKARLNENPDVKIVLDVHRDAIATDDGSKMKLSCNINGESVAQIMFVVGTDAQLSHPDWRENMKLALKLQRRANELYPGLVRPINLRAQRFNQQLSNGSIIIEVGTNGNTMEEAKKGAELIGDVIVSVLSEYKG